MPLFRFDGGLDAAVYDGQVGPLQLGRFSSGSPGYALPLQRSGSKTALFRVYTDDAGVVLYGSGAVPDLRAALSRALVTVNQTGGNIRLFGLMGHLKSYDGYWNNEQVGAVYGRLEITRNAATLTLGGYGISAGVAATVNTNGNITVNTNHWLAGVAAVSDFQATQTQTGIVPAFLAAAYDSTNWSDGTARTTNWTHGLYIKHLGTVAMYALGFSSGSSYYAGVKVGAMTVSAYAAAIKVDIAGTAYYIPICAAAGISGI